MYMIILLYSYNLTHAFRLLSWLQINNANLGWTVGYMLNASNILPQEFPQAPINTVVFIILLILFIAFIFLAVGFVCHAKRVSSRDPLEYQRLQTYGSIWLRCRADFDDCFTQSVKESKNWWKERGPLFQRPLLLLCCVPMKLLRVFQFVYRCVFNNIGYCWRVVLALCEQSWQILNMKFLRSRCLLVSSMLDLALNKIELLSRFVPIFWVHVAYDFNLAHIELSLSLSLLWTCLYTCWCSICTVTNILSPNVVIQCTCINRRKLILHNISYADYCFTSNIHFNTTCSKMPVFLESQILFRSIYIDILANR